MISHGLAYTRTENIHEIVFHDMRNATLSAFGDQLKVIITELPEGESLRLLIHTSAIPSIQYMLSLTREIKAVRQRPIRSRIAVIYGPSLQLYLLNMVVRAIVRTSTIKLFQKKDEAEARQWLAQ